MKKGSTVLCIVLAVVLTLCAVVVGAYRGWRGERQSVVDSFTSDSTLRSYLDTRAMDAANLRVVAARHLPSNDESLAALARDRKTLSDASAGVDAIVAADSELTQTAASLQRTLPTLASVQSSSRDQAYITTLTRTLLEAQSVTDSYNAQVESYNRRLNASLTGKLAQLLGVHPLNAYQAQ